MLIQNCSALPGSNRELLFRKSVRKRAFATLRLRVFVLSS